MSGDVTYVLADVIIFVYEVPVIFSQKNYYLVRWNIYKLRQLSLLQSAVDS